MLRVLAYFGLLIGVAVYAYLKGGRDERAAMFVCVGATLASLAVMSQGGSDYRTLQPLVAVVDIATLGAFAWIALRSERFWPLWISGLQLTSTTGHLLKFVEPDLVPLAYSTALAFWSYLILIILGVGTFRTSRRAPIGAAA